MINQIHLQLQDLCLQEEFVPSALLRGSMTGVVARVESLPLASLGDFVRGRMSEAGNGVSDYFVDRENGAVLAVVEAKKTVIDVRLAEAQLTHYVTEIEKHQSFRPFGFLANGLEIHCVDVGIAH